MSIIWPRWFDELSAPFCMGIGFLAVFALLALYLWMFIDAVRRQPEAYPEFSPWGFSPGARKGIWITGFAIGPALVLMGASLGYLVPFIAIPYYLKVRQVALTPDERAEA